MVIRPWQLAMTGVGAVSTHDAGIEGERLGKRGEGRGHRGDGDMVELGVRQSFDPGLYSAKSFFKMVGEVELTSEEMDGLGGIETSL
jgi:hypothetical protein